MQAWRQLLVLGTVCQWVDRQTTLGRTQISRPGVDGFAEERRNEIQKRE
jgi:hypothetical protein